MSAPTTPRFYIYAPDYTDPEAFSRRLSVRETHLERAGVAIKSGYISMSSAMTSHPDHERNALIDEDIQSLEVYS
jgi:hypothetical protein